MQNADPKHALLCNSLHVNVNYAFVFCINSVFLLEKQFTLQNENKCSSLHRCEWRFKPLFSPEQFQVSSAKK